MPTPAASRAATGVQSPLPRRRRTFHERRAAGTIRSGHPPARFRDGACHPAGSLSTSTPRPPSDANTEGQGWRKTDDSNVRAFAHPLSRRGRYACPVHLPARKAADLNGTGFPAHPLATEPGTPVRFTFLDIQATLKAAYLLSNVRLAVFPVTASGMR